MSRAVARWTRALALGATVAVLAGCPLTPPPSRPAPDLTAGLGTGPSCASARARARETPPPEGLVAPRAALLPLAPQPVPGALRGASATVTVRVDSVGAPASGGVLVSGLSDAAYAERLRKSLVASRYRPAILDGCAVEGTAELHFHL